METPRMDHASSIKARSTEANDIQARMQDVNSAVSKYKNYRQWEKQYLHFFDENPGHDQEKQFQELRKKPYEIEEWMDQVMNDIALIYPKVIKHCNNLSKDVGKAIEIAKGEMRDPEFVLAPARTTSGLSADSTKASPQQAQAAAEKHAAQRSLVDLTPPTL